MKSKRSQRVSSRLEKRREIYALGQRAIDYYVDTGLCVFCEADDCQNVPHEEHCNVGEISGIIVDFDRRRLKAHQRMLVDTFLRTTVRTTQK